MGCWLFITMLFRRNVSGAIRNMQYGKEMQGEGAKGKLP